MCRGTCAYLVIFMIGTTFCGKFTCRCARFCRIENVEGQNAELKAELEDAKAKIEKLEKQLESLRAKDAKVAQDYSL